MSAPPVHLLVFRDGSRPVSGSGLKSALWREIRSLENSSQPDKVLGALLRAGELECAIADARGPSRELEAITDSLAASVINPHSTLNLPKLLSLVEQAVIPEQLSVSVPEGFAYYALHPLNFAEVLDRLPALPRRATVVGIRSIGATLSAMTAAGLRLRGVHATRITVRPIGHPYARRTEFSEDQLCLLQTEIPCGTNFLVVDEGPGLSGSSFLSVGEALLRAGVRREKITLICSHEPSPERMCAENAAPRYRQFRWVPALSKPRRPEGADVWIGNGDWRRFLLENESCWPASWAGFERLKYLSRPGAEARFYKFLGFGHYGEEVLNHEKKVAAAGFGPVPKPESHGFASYPLLDGRPMSAGDLNAEVIAALASYCAFRLRSFAIFSADLDPLRQMAEHNLQQSGFDLPIALQLQRAVIADGRMQPHEWLLTKDGRMLKSDSGTHGDDHFFPGPTDIAWDLAGAIVEWRMNAADAEAFLTIYHRASGDDAGERITDYITAYAVFRWAYCTMAANAILGDDEQIRLERRAEYYRAHLRATVPRALANQQF
jgi:hypothetical protein